MCSSDLEGPCFVAAQQLAGNTGFIHLHLGVSDQYGVIPHPICQVSHCCCCFADALVQLGIQEEVAGDGRAKVDGVFYHLKVKSLIEMFGMDAADILTQYVGLLEADEQAKLFV